MSTWPIRSFGAVSTALLLALALSRSANAAPPSVTTFAWTDPGNMEVHTNTSNPADVPHVIRLTYGIANADSATVTIQAPPNVAIVQVSIVAGGTGSWSSTITRVPNSNPWQSSATLTLNSNQGLSNLTGSFAIAYRTRNGGFLSGEVGTFAATVNATSGGESTNANANIGVRFLSEPTLNFQGGNTRNSYGVYNGQVGIFRTWTMAVLREYANGRIDPDIAIALNVPSPARFIRLDPVETTSNPWTLVSQPAVGTSGTAQMTFQYQLGVNGALSTTGAVPTIATDIRTDTEGFRVVFFVPCAELPTGNVLVSLTATGTQQGTDDTWDQTVNGTASTEVRAVDCNVGVIGKSTTVDSTIVAPGNTARFVISAQGQAPADGSFPTNVVVVDRLPDGVSDFSSVTVSSGSSESFELYLCRAPSFAGTFDYAAFDVLRNAPDTGEFCRPQAAFPPAVEPTHLVAWAAEWRDEVAPGLFGMTVLAMTVSVIVHDDAQTGSYVNRVCLDGAEPDSGTGWAGPFPASYPACPTTAGGPATPPTGCRQACFSVTNDTLPRVALNVRNLDTPAAPTTYNRGERAEFNISVYRSQDAYLQFDPQVPNNVVRFLVPPGFDVESAVQLSPCIPDVVVGNTEFIVEADPPTPAGTLVTMTPRTFLSIERCAGTSANIPSAWGFRITTRVSQNYPFVQGQSYPATVDYNVRNSTQTPTESVNLNVFAPSELLLSIAGTSCTTDGLGGTATFINQGGDVLENIVLDVAIPAGSTWDANLLPAFQNTVDLQSLAVPYGISWIVGGIPQSTAPADPATVQAVRLEVPALPPYARGDFTVLVDASLGQPDYVFSADIMADGGLQTDDVQPFSTAGCPCTIEVQKVFSAVIDGNPAMPIPMAGVMFRLEGPFGYDQIHATDDAGYFGLTELPPGTWTLTEIAPNTVGGASIAAPFGGQWSTTVQLAPQGTQVIDVTNVCSCTDAPCVDEGSCSWDPDTYTAACNSTPVECGDGICGSICDPMVDACVSAEPAPCNNPGGHVIWGTATDSDGSLKFFRCTVSGTGAAPTCVTDPVTGYLVLFDADGGQCQP